jgi:hypothetical protein
VSVPSIGELGDRVRLQAEPASGRRTRVANDWERGGQPRTALPSGHTDAVAVTPVREQRIQRSNGHFHRIESAVPHRAGGGETAYTETLPSAPSRAGEVFEGRVERREFVPAQGGEPEQTVSTGTVDLRFDRAACVLHLPYVFGFRQRQTPQDSENCEEPPHSEHVDPLPDPAFIQIKRTYIEAINEGLNGWYAVRIEGCGHRCADRDIPIRVAVREDSSDIDLMIDVVNRGGRADSRTICARSIDTGTAVHEGGHQVLGHGDEYRERDPRVLERHPERGREERVRPTDFSMMHAGSWGRFGQFHARHFRFAEAFVEAVLMSEGIQPEAGAESGCNVRLVELRRPIMPDVRLELDVGALFGNVGAGFTVGAGVEVGLPLERRRRWAALLGAHGRMLVGLSDQERTAFLAGARAGIERSWLTDAGAGRVGAFVEGGALFERRRGGGFRPAAPYVEAGFSAGFTGYVPGAPFHPGVGLELAAGTELGGGPGEEEVERGALRWYRAGVAAGFLF